MVPLQLLQGNATSWWEPELHFITWALSTAHTFLKGAKSISDTQCGAAPWSGHLPSLKPALFSLYLYYKDCGEITWFFLAAATVECPQEWGAGVQPAVALWAHCVLTGHGEGRQPSSLQLTCQHLLLVCPYCRGLEKKKKTLSFFHFLNFLFKWANTQSCKRKPGEK